MVYSIPFDFRNSSNMALGKLVPLSVTCISRIPKVAQVDHIFSIVTDEVVIYTSMHPFQVWV